jgi:hypothetical protein
MATYYVDAVNGIDSNNGTSAGTAWKTVASASGRTFGADAQLLFKRGQTFRGLFVMNSANGSSGHPVIVGAYDTGADPIISGGFNLGSTGQWTASGNIWHTAAITGSPYDMGMVLWGDGYTNRGVKKASAGACAANGNWFYDMAAHVMYIYSDSGTNPATRWGTGLEATQKFNTGMDVNCSIGNGSSFITVQNIAFKNYGYHVMLLFGSVHDIIFDACTFQNGGGGQDGTGSYSGSDGYGIELWTNQNLNISNITIKNCMFRDLEDYGVSFQTDGSSTNTFSNIAIYKNTFWRCGGGAVEIWMNASGTQTGSNLTVAHNTCYECGMGSFMTNQYPYVFTVTGSTNATFSNCKWVNNLMTGLADPGKAWWVARPAILSNWTINKNVYYPSLTYFCNTGSNQSWATWRGLGGSPDANSYSTTDPLLNNPANGNFTPTASSICVNNGVDAGLGLSYLGSSWDIGAYEYDFGAPPPVITGLTPNSGGTTGSTTVTITGTNLTGATTVNFGNISATGVVVQSATTIVCNSPVHAAGVIDVTVITAGGTSSTSGTGNDYTYTQSPLPGKFCPFKKI